MTVNLPGKLRGTVAAVVKSWRYPTLSDYCSALILWDIYSRQTHTRTGPLMREPQWRVDGFVDSLLERRGETVSAALLKPYRFSVRAPEVIYPLAQTRIEEEHYKSDSAYITSLVIYDLDTKVPAGKGIPHHRLANLMREPKWVKEAVIAALAADFGNPKRRWPKGIDGRVEQLVSDQRELRLGV